MGTECVIVFCAESNDETGGNLERPDSRASSGLDSAEADHEIGQDAEEDNETGLRLRPHETSAALDKLVRD